MKENKTEYSDSNDAPSPELYNLYKQKLEKDCLICPECSSMIEIITLNEENNMLEYKCIKNNHKNNKISITEYLYKIKKIKKENINDFKDHCEKHKNIYITYCFDCNYHLCNDCLKLGNHINHKKSNIIEIQPLEQELKIISEVIQEQKNNLEKLYKAKERKIKELNKELNNKQNKENNLLKEQLKFFNIINNVELEQNNKKFLLDIFDVKKKYEEEIKKIKKRYCDVNNNINNKYKLKSKKEQIKHNIKIDKLNQLYKNKYDSYQFESKIEKAESIIKINENIFNVYNTYNNNYFNAININNILVSYNCNKSHNEKMKRIFGNDYEQIMNMIKNKYKEGINIIEKRNELEELKTKIKEDTIKYNKLSEINIELNKKNENKEKENIKLNEQIKLINEEKKSLNNKIEEINKKIEDMNNKLEEKNEKISELNKLNEDKKKECIQMRNKLDKYQKFEEFTELEKYKAQNTSINFRKDPSNLRYNKNITENHNNSGLLKNFDVFVRLKDSIAYIVYQNIDLELIVMRIRDENKMESLIGHKSNANVIRYYHNKNNKIKEEEYILSCDDDKIIIVWDINDNYNKKYILKENYKDNIYDSILLFSIFNKDYILLSSDNHHNSNEFCKLYEFKQKTPFIKNIYNTNKIKNFYLIPWLYKNKYYLISCSDSEISINNIFEEETYANLRQKPEGKHYCGFLYRENFLCVSDVNNDFIRIWDLVNKNIYKTININNEIGYELVLWNDSYVVIGCDKHLVVVDLEEENEDKILERNIYGVKKIKSEILGECLICSEKYNCINIYDLKSNIDVNVDEGEIEGEEYEGEC